ncbi:MAG: hypothetical protein ABIJ27_00590 [Candidatus Omnitrophota bacterium]
MRPGGVVLCAAIVFIGAVCLAARFPLLDVPLERDEGEYAYIAQQMAPPGGVAGSGHASLYYFDGELEAIKGRLDPLGDMRLDEAKPKMTVFRRTR